MSSLTLPSEKKTTFASRPYSRSDAVDELWRLTVAEASKLLRRRAISSLELTRSVLERIGQVEGKVQAYIRVTEDVALEQAAEADRRLAEGTGDYLTGIPFSLKDLMCTRGIPTTCASRILDGFVPVYNATVTERLLEAGAVLVGKTNMDEFAMGSSTENSAFFPTRNPWDLSRVPGGSSGGSAAAVAAGECLFSLGSDTGGSIRQPAALCGITGLKPTYGLVSRYGLVAFASSLDQIGPLARSVEDVALVLQAIAGHDPNDSTSIQRPVPNYLAALVPDLKGIKIAVPVEYFGEGIDEGVKACVREAIETLCQLGAEVSEVSLPHTRYALPTYYIIAPAEASANLARYDGIKYGYSAPDAADLWDVYFKTRQRGFGSEVKRRIMLGTYALSAGYYEAYYLKAQKVRTLIKQDMDRVFQEFHAIASPTSPTVAFTLGERTADPLQMYMSDILTIPCNLAGLPGMSIPCGFSDGLPVGLQLVGPAFGEATLLRIGYAYQQATDWHLRWPSGIE
jgi:aspartyl-tRNA(Asn)/glutamyl-tRNA(Gln) amidotransferase subunit A